jgi:hypothetical protein
MSITDDLDALKKKIQAEHEDELRRRKDKLQLDHFAALAQQRVYALAARATEISTVQKAHALDRRDEETLLAARPGLQPWIDRLHEAERHLHGLTFGQQATLQQALERHKRLTLEDFALPVPPSLPAVTPFGPLPVEVWRLREALANLTALEDVDVAIARLRERFAELNERIISVAA